MLRVSRKQLTEPFSLWKSFGIERHHQLILKWLLLTGVVVFIFALAVHYGLVDRVITTDKSYISSGITILYVVTTLHCMIQSWFISRQLNIAGKVAAEFSNAPAIIQLDTIDGKVHLGQGLSLSPGVVADHVQDLLQKGSPSNGSFDQTLLLQAYSDKLSGRQEIGFLISDLMLRLGLLGTVIGFIFMLGPLSSIQTIDVTSMRGVLSSMSGGMAIALYTTLVGLVGGMLLRLQYFFVERSVEDLVTMTTEITEVFVIPLLEKETRNP